MGLLKHITVIRFCQSADSNKTGATHVSRFLHPSTLGAGGPMRNHVPNLDSVVKRNVNNLI